MSRYQIYRPDGNIAKELAVCGGCLASLKTGSTIGQLSVIAKPHKQPLPQQQQQQQPVPLPSLVIERAPKAKAIHFGRTAK